MVTRVLKDGDNFGQFYPSTARHFLIKTKKGVHFSVGVGAYEHCCCVCLETEVYDWVILIDQLISQVVMSLMDKNEKLEDLNSLYTLN